MGLKLPSAKTKSELLPFLGSGTRDQTMSVHQSTKKITVPWVRNQKSVQRLTMLTAYDYPTAHWLDGAGVEMILVGDSLGNVIYGKKNTLSVQMGEMVRHTEAVSLGATRAMVIGDLPFLSYQTSIETAVLNAGRFLSEGGAQAVKLEGGSEVCPQIEAITRAGIPVVAHIGLLPQSVHAAGGYRMHGKSEEERKILLQAAQDIERAGAFCVVLECVEEGLAKEITESISIPTIGIGAGDVCDGEVLVIHDLLGLTVGRIPKFVNPEANMGQDISQAVRRFIDRTKNRDQLELPKAGLKFKTQSSQVSSVEKKLIN